MIGLAMVDAAVGIDAGADEGVEVCFPPNIFFQKDCLAVEDTGAFVAAEEIGMDGRCIADDDSAGARATGIFRSPGGRIGVMRGAEDSAVDDGAGGVVVSGVEIVGLIDGCEIVAAFGPLVAGVGHALVRGAMEGEAGVALTVRGRAAACAAVGDDFGRLASPR